MVNEKWKKLKPEFQLVLNLIQIYDPDVLEIRNLLEQHLDWAEILGVLCYYRIAGAAYYTIKKCHPLPQKTNGDFILALMTIYEAQRVRTESMNLCITEIADKLNIVGVKYAFLKGAFLSNTIYPLGGRMSNDIDILVDVDDLSKCSEVLVELGYVQGYVNTGEIVEATRKEIINQRLNYGEIVPFHKNLNRPGLNIVTVDVNFSLDETATRMISIARSFLDNRMLYPIRKGIEAFALDIEYCYAYVCEHLFKEATVIDWVIAQRDLSLYKFLDIYALAGTNKFSIDWDKLGSVIKDNNLEQECYFAFYYALQFFPGLSNNKNYIALLERIEPSEKEYLDGINKVRTKEVLEWKEDIWARVFDLKCYNKLVEF